MKRIQNHWRGEARGRSARAAKETAENCAGLIRRRNLDLRPCAERMKRGACAPRSADRLQSSTHAPLLLHEPRFGIRDDGLKNVDQPLLVLGWIAAAARALAVVVGRAAHARHAVQE